jgi:hypothetical protein
MLTTDADKLTGTVNSDTFTGSVGGNNDTLQSDDIIGGGAGTDTLDVTLANTPFAITPRSSSVEILKVRSQADGDDEGTNDVQGYSSSITKNLTADNAPGTAGVNNVKTIVTAGDNTIDAQNMVGTSQFWNSNSRADLVIEDVRNNSHETTLGFQSTDPGDVDYAVFFDPSHIKAPGGVASGATLTVRLADVLGLKVDTNGLKNLPYNGMTITVGTKDVTLPIDFAKLTSYADFVTAINAALVKAGLTTITATAGTAETAVFSTAVSGFAQGSVAGTFNPVILTNSGPEGITLKGYALNTGAQEPNGNLVRTFTINEQVTVNALTQVNMILDDVGRGSMAGDFLAGSMSTGASGSKGIAQFNVSVDRSSHITTLQTTNNGLEVVNVKNIGANGNLRLDDNNLTDTDYGLTDVRVFDASTMTGRVTLSAVLSQDVVSKYMDLTDTGTPSGDNSDPLPFRDVVDQEFSYDLGSGNDSLYLNISNANLAAAGTTTREDFVLTINGNAGDDTVTTQIGTGAGVGNENWYTNSTINANLSINTGEGNDTVNTVGAGNWKINTGAGNDTVYSDNSGLQKAVWVFNTADQATAAAAGVRDLTNLVSSANTSYELYKATAEVTFRGLTSVKVNIESTNYKTSDLQINQAIKQAINSDPVLSKLLKATDGPANTLVVTSLTDGVQAATNLSVNVVKPVAGVLTAAEITAAGAAYTGTPTTEVNVLAAMDDTTMDATDYLANFAGTTLSAAQISGTDSNNAADSTHNLGAGNDVLVLSTNHANNLPAGANANATSSNETVVYNAIGFGNDTIVNFNSGDVVPFALPEVADGAPTVADAGEDKLDFTALGGKTFVGTAAIGVGAVNVIAVRSVIATTLDDATDVAALFAATTNTAAQSHIMVLVSAGNVGSVYQVTDAAGAASGSATAALIGTIDLADTSWLALSADNFA